MDGLGPVSVTYSKWPVLFIVQIIIMISKNNFNDEFEDNLVKHVQLLPYFSFKAASYSVFDSTHTCASAREISLLEHRWKLTQGLK